VSMPSFSIEGKIAIVTGARRGIGKAIALTFAQAGADVAVCDFVVEGGELEAVAEEIRGFGQRSLAVQADVSKKDDVDNFVEKATHELGPIDILVNNAGISRGSVLIQQSFEDWQAVIGTNLTGCFLCSQAVGVGMIERKKGIIINIASGAGIRGFAGRNAYNVSKAGVIMITKVLARDLARYGIRVNALAPTNLKTDMTRGLWENPQTLAAEEARIPLGRLGDVDDMTGPALFLASDASSYITGHTIVLDGGSMA
jgi:NAD(P)-dependent dehydrogenase (short-subunit alcohol dehydrogenase family)